MRGRSRPVTYRFLPSRSNESVVPSNCGITVEPRVLGRTDAPLVPSNRRKAVRPGWDESSSGMRTEGSGPIPGERGSRLFLTVALRELNAVACGTNKSQVEMAGDHERGVHAA